MRTLARFCVLAAVLLPACKKHGDVTAAARPSAEPAPPPVASVREPDPPGPPPSAAVGPRLLTPAKKCRALDVKGRVVDENGRALVTSAPLDRDDWLDLDAGARLAIEHTETSRELTFLGKGRVLPCASGEERFYVVRGGVRTAAAAGARPGAEVLVATPFGVVRYGDARLDITVDAHGIAVRADQGDAWLESANGDASGIAEEKIPAGKRLERKGLTVDVKSLLHICEVTAEAAEARARNVLHPGDTDRAAPLGVRAAEHVKARRTARYACAIAEATLGTVEIGGDRDALAQSLGRAEARFLGVPTSTARTEKIESR